MTATKNSKGEELATKSYVDGAVEHLVMTIGEVRDELKQEIGGVRQEVGSLKQEMGSMKQEILAAIDDLKKDTLESQSNLQDRVAALEYSYKK